MLRTRTWKSSSLRLLNDSDRDEALLICDRDAVTNVFVSARLRAAGLNPGRLGAQLWGYSDGGRLTSLCYSGANLVPVAATSLLGIDALLSIVQMPLGVPVGTLAIGKAGAGNAALLAAQIVAGTHAPVRARLAAWRQRRKDAVMADTVL